MKYRAERFAIGLAAATLLAPSSPVTAQSLADFYKNATISLIISTGVGGGNDAVARLLARHMPKYIPGSPTIVAKNMPGAGSILATNHLYNIAPKDGSVIGTVAASVFLQQPLRADGVKFKAEDFHYLGSTGVDVVTVFSWHTSSIKTIEDLYTKELVIGGTGAGGSTTTYPMIMNNVLGTKFKIISGYKTSQDIDLALVRGEVEGRGAATLQSIKSTHPDWLAERRINFLAQIGLERHRDLPDVPLLTDLAKTDDQRQILQLFSAVIGVGRPFFSTPQLPVDRAAALRAAFEKTMSDAEFLAECEKARIDIALTPGAKLANIVKNLVSTPPDVAERAKAVSDDSAVTKAKP